MAATEAQPRHKQTSNDERREADLQMGVEDFSIGQRELNRQKATFRQKNRIYQAKKAGNRQMLRAVLAASPGTS
jgi:hypothetical protein